MHSHNSHQRFYHYAGPPSIVMGTWGDRSRSQFAPPPAPFAIPPAGVPGGRLGPAPNRINAGYHSLQYTPVTAHVDYGKVLEKKNANNSSKHHHHGSHRHERHDHHQVHQVAQPNLAGSGDHQQLHKLPQVKAFVTQVEQSAKKQLKSSSSHSKSRDHHHISSTSTSSKSKQQSLWAADSDPVLKSVKPAQHSKTAPPAPAPTPATTTTKQPPSLTTKEKQKELSPKTMILTSSKQPNGSSSSGGSGGAGSGSPTSSSESSLDRAPKPQFYFGQTMNDVVRKSSVVPNGSHQTAIDKVKKNEALSHPKRTDQDIKANKVAVVTELNKKGRHTSIISVSDEPSSGNVVVEKKISSQKAASLSSGVSSLSSSSGSSSSSTRSSPAKDASPPPPSISSSSPAKPPPPVAASAASKQKSHQQAHPQSSVERLKIKSVEPTQDSIRKAFEAQLIAGKNRLKKVEDEVGQVAKPPPASVPPVKFHSNTVTATAAATSPTSVPPPPPPMPPSEDVLHRNGGVPRSYEIPQAPKLKKTPPTMATKKGLVAPNGLSAREELMNAIRGTGGFHGLRKINSGKNL